MDDQEVEGSFPSKKKKSWYFTRFQARTSFLTRTQLTKGEADPLEESPYNSTAIIKERALAQVGYKWPCCLGPYDSVDPVLFEGVCSGKNCMELIATFSRRITGETSRVLCGPAMCRKVLHTIQKTASL